MANRIVIAGVAIFMTIVLLPVINDLLTGPLMTMMNSSTLFTMSPFERAIWMAIPLVLLIYCGLQVLVSLIKGEPEEREREE